MTDDKNPKVRPDFSRVTSSDANPRADFSNVTGASTSSAPSAEPIAPAARTYTVRSGDSLSKIAKEFYGDAHKWPAIHEANKDQIKNPDLIHPGQTFVIPDLPST